jgi:hypothetical protein
VFPAKVGVDAVDVASVDPGNVITRYDDDVSSVDTSKVNLE